MPSIKESHEIAAPPVIMPAITPPINTDIPAKTEPPKQLKLKKKLEAISKIQISGRKLFIINADGQQESIFEIASINNG